ncbi:hypothetical protein EDB19DRAFT_2029369 [Suillus lakei]|nr:hypothetical protein EDB19DRAFT_2029369 [Suillus lakei]
MNVATGQWRSFREFLKRVHDGATALGADMMQGGLGLCPENRELVGILSENCPDYVALLHSLLVFTVPFALFSSYPTMYEFKHANSLAQVTRIFASPFDRKTLVITVTAFRDLLTSMATQISPSINGHIQQEHNYSCMEGAVGCKIGCVAFGMCWSSEMDGRNGVGRRGRGRAEKGMGW